MAPDDISNLLLKLGFTSNESKVYLCLIRLGNSHAGAVAKESRLDRSSTYNALKSLVEKGMVGTVFENKRSIFVPADPARILDYIREKEELAKKALPLLKSRFDLEREKKSVTLFQGYRGLKTVFEDILRTCGKDSEYLVLGSEGQFSSTMPHYSPIFRKRKEDKRIKTRLLAREGLPNKPRGSFSQVRKLPFDISSQSTINIYGNKISIIIWDEKPEVVLVENAKVAESFRNYFEFMWRHAEK